MSHLIDYVVQLILDSIKFRHERKQVLIVYAIVVVTVAYFVFFNNQNAQSIIETDVVPEVVVQSIQNLASGSIISTIGIVEAVSEARLQVEAGGRVMVVNTKLGSSVSAGTVIARIENASQSASLLQAQGAYEAALAGAAQSGVGVNQADNVLLSAKNAALGTERTAYSVVSDIFYNKVNNVIDDPYISAPTVVLIGSEGSFLREEWKSYKKILSRWQISSSMLTVDGDLDTALTVAKTNVVRLINIIDILVRILNDSNQDKLVAGQTVEAQKAIIVAQRINLNTTLSSLETAEVGLRNALNTQKQAQLAGASGEQSLSSAQVKIALGSLRAAQANYERTLVRTPISGVVNALYLKAGDYVNPGQAAGIIANNNGLEINAAVSFEDSIKLSVGDSVAINNNTTGTINALGGAIDPTTGKVALKISVPANSSLQNGSTVSIDFETKTQDITDEISVPLSAVKLTGSGPVLYTVSSSSALVSLPVVLGAINGESVIVKEGVNLDTTIVVDARGLKDGQLVKVVIK